MFCCLGSPIYQKRPSCGFPPEAPSGTHLSPPAGLFCPFQTVTYTCDIGGINEIKDQPGISTIDGVCSPEGVLELPEEFGDPDSDPVVLPSVECVASYTCELLDLLIPATPGK